MATVQSTKFVQFAFPLSNPPFYNHNTLWPAKTSHNICSLTNSQKVHRSTTTLSGSVDQAETDRNTAIKTKDRKRAHSKNNKKSDDDLPSLEKLEELSRKALRRKVSTKASETEFTIQRLEQPALNEAELQVDRIQLGLGECPGNSRDQPMILNNNPDKPGARDKTDGASKEVDTGYVKGDTSPYHTFLASKPVPAPTEPNDTSGPWYDVEEGRYIEEPAPGLGSHEQPGVPSTPAQASKPLQDQANQQGVDHITRSTSVESAFHFLPKPSNSGDDGWTDESMAELEKELGLAIEGQQVASLSAGTGTSLSPHSIKAPQNKTQSREHTETDSRQEELQDASLHGTAQSLEEYDQQDTEMIVEGRTVVMQQQGELGQPAMGDQQHLVKVVDADVSEDMEATEALLAAQPQIYKISEHRFRLRGIRTRQLAGRQTKTTQYRVVWGERPNRLDFWFNENDVRISMLQPPCELYSPKLALTAEMDISRVRSMNCSWHKGRKVFYYLVNVFGLDDNRITEDQLRISISPTLVAKLKASSPPPFNQAQREGLLRHSTFGNDYRPMLRASRSSSASADPALNGEPATRKRGHGDTHIEVSSEIPHSVNTNENHNSYDTNDEDPRPAKRRKSRAAPAVTLTTSRGLTPKLHVGQPGPLVALSTTTPETSDAEPQADHAHLSAFVDNSHHHTLRTSRSPSTAPKAVPLAEYQERPFQGLLKCIKIGDDITYNLEFKLPSISGLLHLPIDPSTLDICSSRELAKVPTHHDVAAHPKTRQAPLQPKTGRAKWAKWTKEEDAKLLQMRKDGCSWDDIHAALPHRSIGTIQVHYSTKLKK